MKKNRIDRLTAWICSFVMIAALAFTFLAVPAAAGNILFVTGNERDPVLTEEQIEELRSEMQATYSLGAARQMQMLEEKNREKSREYEAAVAELAVVKAQLEAKVAQFNAYDDVWIALFDSIQEEPAYLAAKESGDSSQVLSVALTLIGKTEAEYNEYLAECARMNAEMDELSNRCSQLELEIAIHQPIL